MPTARQLPAVLADIQRHGRCEEVGVEYTCGHRRPADVQLAAFLQDKREPRSMARALRLACRRETLPAGDAGTFRIDAPSGPCQECGCCNRGASLWCGGVAMEMPSSSASQETLVPVGVSAVQFLEWMEMEPDGASSPKVQLSPGFEDGVASWRALFLSTVGGRVLIFATAWILGCLVYATCIAPPEAAAFQPAQVYQQIQEQIRNIPLPIGSPHYAFYRKHYLEQYQQFLKARESEPTTSAQEEGFERKLTLNTTVLLRGLGFGGWLLVVVLAGCEYRYCTMSIWIEVLGEKWLALCQIARLPRIWQSARHVSEANLLEDSKGSTSTKGTSATTAASAPGKATVAGSRGSVGSSNAQGSDAASAAAASPSLGAGQRRQHKKKKNSRDPLAASAPAPAKQEVQHSTDKEVEEEHENEEEEETTMQNGSVPSPPLHPEVEPSPKRKGRLGLGAIEKDKEEGRRHRKRPNATHSTLPGAAVNAETSECGSSALSPELQPVESAGGQSSSGRCSAHVPSELVASKETQATGLTCTPAPVAARSSSGTMAWDPCHYFCDRGSRTDGSQVTAETVDTSNESSLVDLEDARVSDILDGMGEAGDDAARRFRRRSLSLLRDEAIHEVPILPPGLENCSSSSEQMDAPVPAAGSSDAGSEQMGFEEDQTSIDMPRDLATLTTDDLIRLLFDDTIRAALIQRGIPLRKHLLRCLSMVQISEPEVHGNTTEGESTNGGSWTEGVSSGVLRADAPAFIPANADFVPMDVPLACLLPEQLLLIRAHLEYLATQEYSIASEISAQGSPEANWEFLCRAHAEAAHEEAAARAKAAARAQWHAMK